jgi:hypothetical protein
MFRLSLHLCWLVFLLVLVPNHSAAQADFLPIDEAVSNPEFFAFRARLHNAIVRRDVAAAQAVLHPEVKLSFGGDYGLQGFMQLWEPSSPQSQLWETLATVLALGGTFADDGSFTAPYVFSRWPNEKDAFTHVAVIGQNVPVYSAASNTAAVTTTVSFTVIEVASDSAFDEPWVKVVLNDKRSGYLERRFVRSPLDYRVRFIKQDEHWLMELFVAGD